MENNDANPRRPISEPASSMSSPSHNPQRRVDHASDESCPANLVTVPRDAADVNSDGAFLELVARRADGALESLYHAVSPRLYAVALRILSDPEDAQEALQDAFLRIWERAPSFNPALARPFTWMVMILRGLCLDRLRKRRVRASIATESLDVLTAKPSTRSTSPALASPGDAFLRAEIIDELRQAFDTLPASDQILLNRVLFSPAEIDDIATDLGQPVGTVKSRIHRAITKLRILLRWDHENAN